MANDMFYPLVQLLRTSALCVLLLSHPLLAVPLPSGASTTSPRSLGPDQSSMAVAQELSQRAPVYQASSRIVSYQGRDFANRRVHLDDRDLNSLSTPSGLHSTFLRGRDTSQEQNEKEKAARKQKEKEKQRSGKLHKSVESTPHPAFAGASGPYKLFWGPRGEPNEREPQSIVVARSDTDVDAKLKSGTRKGRRDLELRDPIGRTYPPSTSVQQPRSSFWGPRSELSRPYTRAVVDARDKASDLRGFDEPVARVNVGHTQNQSTGQKAKDDGKEKVDPNLLETYCNDKKNRKTPACHNKAQSELENLGEHAKVELDPKAIEMFCKDRKNRKTWPCKGGGQKPSGHPAGKESPRKKFWGPLGGRPYPSHFGLVRRQILQDGLLAPARSVSERDTRANTMMRRAGHGLCGRSSFDCWAGLWGAGGGVRGLKQSLALLTERTLTLAINVLRPFARRAAYDDSRPSRPTGAPALQAREKSGKIHERLFDHAPSSMVHPLSRRQTRSS